MLYCFIAGFWTVKLIGASINYGFSLSPCIGNEYDHTTISTSQASLEAQEWLDVTNAKTSIQADAKASNHAGDQANVGIKMGPGTLLGYTNSATATDTYVEAKQSAPSGSGSSSGKIITISGNAIDSSGTYSVNTPLSGSFTGLSALSSAGTTTQVSQIEQIVGSFSSTATAPGIQPKTRTSNFGVKYDLNMLAGKDSSGSSVSGVLGYYVDPSMASKSKKLILGAIQGAVNVAQSGDTINAAAGTYSEAVDIKKGLTLKGSGNPTATSFSLTNSAILGAGSGGITAPLVTVNSGSTIQDGITLASTNGKVNVNAGTYGDNLDQSFYANGVTLTGINNPVTNSFTLDQDVAGKISGITANTVTVNPTAKILQGIGLANTNGAVFVNGATGYTYSDDLTQNFYATGVTLTGINNPVTNSFTLDQDVAGKISGITANTVNVLNPNAKIQDGLDLASSGGTVNVATGTYSEAVNINKAITLKGSGSPTATSFSLTNSAILGTGSGGITAPLVTVNSGSKIQDGVTLASSGGTVNVAAGTYAEKVQIDKSVTVIGAGAGNTIVDGNHVGSVFTIGRAAPSANVALSGMTIQGGTGTFNGNLLGGGIWNAGALVLNDVTITGNTANYGGGIYNGAGTVTFLDSNGDTLPGYDTVLDPYGFFTPHNTPNNVAP